MTNLKQAYLATQETSLPCVASHLDGLQHCSSSLSGTQIERVRREQGTASMGIHFTSRPTAQIKTNEVRSGCPHLPSSMRGEAAKGSDARD
jgi:hypothetical protein